MEHDAMKPKDLLAGAAVTALGEEESSSHQIFFDVFSNLSFVILYFVM